MNDDPDQHVRHRFQTVIERLLYFVSESLIATVIMVSDGGLNVLAMISVWVRRSGDSPAR